MLNYKAAVLREFNDVSIEDVSCVEIPKDSVVVKVFLSGICRSQLMEFRGGRGEDKWLPHLFGHEAVGEVLSFGSGVSKLNVKDKVILTWIGANPKNFVPPKILDINGNLINSGKIATITQIAIVHKDCCIKKPNGISDEVAVLFGCALGTGSGIAIKLFEKIDELNSQICVLGLGGVGMSSLITLVAKNCKNITAIDNNENKLEWCRKNFNINTILLTEDWLTKNKNSFDFCIEASGSTLGIETGFSLVKKGGGILTFASHPPDDEVIRIKPHDLISGKIIQGSWGGEIFPKKDFIKLAQIFQNYQKLLVDSTGPVFKLSETKDALKSLETKNAFRPMIDMRI